MSNPPVATAFASALREWAIADAAVAGRPMSLRLRVRRFVCEAAGCATRAFVEQLEGLRRGKRGKHRCCGGCSKESAWRWPGGREPG